jgi:hypothetical protein
MYSDLNILCFVIALILLGGNANAHQFLPTYPKFDQSFVSDVSYVKMELFNKRKEIQYYELSVFDIDWKPLSFASESKLIQIGYLETKKINVYVKNGDVKRVSFICTESKLKKEETKQTLISSKICSKIK